MSEHAVVIAGAGPTGLMLAAELALAKIDVAIVERRTSQDLAGSRAGGLHSRTLEIFRSDRLRRCSALGAHGAVLCAAQDANDSVPHANDQHVDIGLAQDLP
jgi:2-polyprenyl-6-methoxyphenol hydroxylase-like FAD-dependent oxidoreductase